MEATVTIDGREVRFRATAAIPRLYRIRFRRDILQDFQAVQRAIDQAQEATRGKPTPPSTLPVEALELFEDMAYIMAKHADPQAVPNDPDEWLEGFSTFSIYGVFPVIRALWEGNTEALDICKKKRDPSTGT